MTLELEVPAPGMLRMIRKVERFVPPNTRFITYGPEDYALLVWMGRGRIETVEEVTEFQDAIFQFDPATGRMVVEAEGYGRWIRSLKSEGVER